MFKLTELVRFCCALDSANIEKVIQILEDSETRQNFKNLLNLDYSLKRWIEYRIFKVLKVSEHSDIFKDLDIEI